MPLPSPLPGTSSWAKFGTSKGTWRDLSMGLEREQVLSQLSPCTFMLSPVRPGNGVSKECYQAWR